MKDLTKAIIRLIITAMLVINATLTAKGMNPIPFDEAAVSEWLTYIASGVSVLWVYWKNNNITEAAQQGQEVINAIKMQGVMENEEDEQEVE